MNRHTITRALAATGVFGVLVSAIFAFMPTGTALAGTGINQEINFQGKLVNSDGTNIPDGTYNMEFKIYTGGDGTVAGDSHPSGSPGTLQWTEDYLINNTQGVSVSAGIFQVSLGSITSLPTSIFNNDTIWMSINLGNTTTTCTPFSSCGGDGEMLPMIRYTAAPYSFNSLQLGGLTASQFAQLSPASAQSGSLNVTGDVAAGTALQAPLVDTATGVALDIGTGTATSVTIGRTTTPFLIQGDSGTSGSKLTGTNGSNTTTVEFANPTVNSTLSFASTVAGSYTICTTEASTCSSTYATSGGGTFLAKNSADTSSAAITAGNYLYGFTNSQATATTGGVLNLNNDANTGNTLNVTASGNPAATTNALVVVNNTAATPSGNLLDLQKGGVNQLSVDYQGNVTQVGGSATTDTINGQTISAAANFTGTVTAATSVLTPLVDTASSGVLAVGTANATAIDLNQNTVVATNKSFTANGSALFNDATTSGTAFQIQAAGSAFVTGDTANKTLTVQGSADDSSTIVVANTDGSAAIQIRPGGIGGQNTFVGDNSGALNVVNVVGNTGIYNSGFGYNALANNSTGYAVTGVGTDALQHNTTGYWNTSLGVASDYQETTGHDNVGVGVSSLNDNISGLYNVGVGDGALYNSTGNENTAIGQSSLYNTTGANNTALGYASGTTLTTGGDDTFLGNAAGYNDSNGFTTGTGVQNSAAIGYGSQVQASNSVTIGGQGANAVNVGIGTTIPLSTLSVSPVRYITGTAAIGTAGTSAGTTITGTGTNWTSDLVGMQFIFANGESGIITGVTNQTSLTVNSNLPVTTTSSYRIQYLGVEASSIGNLSVGVVNPLPSAPSFETSSSSSNAGSESATFTNSSGNISGQFLGDGTVNLGGNGTTVTYGLTTQGSSTGTGFNGMIDAMKFTASATGTMRSMSTYIGNVDPATHNQGQMAIYQDSSGNPGAYLASTSVNPLDDNTWNTWPITSGTATITSGQSYWLTYWSNENTGAQEDNQYWNSGVSGVSWYFSTGNTFGSGADNGMPATYPSGTRVDNNFDFSIYGTMADSSVAEQISGANGATTFKNTSNSTKAFQVQNAAGLNVLGVDTTNAQAVLGTNNVASGINGTAVFEDGTTDGFTGSLKLQGALPGSATYELPNVSGTQVICTTLSTTACDSVYQAAGNYLLQSPAANDGSTSNFAGYQYTFTQSNTGAAGNLSLVNSGTNPSLSVAGSGNPSSTNALEVINNTAGTPSGNSLDIQKGGVNELSVDYNGNLNQINGTTTTDTINGQTISSAASFTGTVTAATSVLTPALDTASAGTLSIGTTTATTINVGTGTGSETVAIGSGSTGSNTDSVTVGSNNSTSTTNINGGTGTNGVNVLAGSNGGINIGTSNSNTTDIGGVAGTIGYTSVGTTQDSGDNNLIAGGEYTAPSTGTISSVSAYVGPLIDSGHKSYTIGIYNDNGSNVPSTLVAQTAAGTLTASAWNTLPISASVTGGNNYWIVYWTNTTAAADNDLVYNNVSGALHHYAYTTGVTWSSTMPGTFPAPTSDVSSNYFQSMYATYGTTTGPAVVVASDGSLTANASSTFKDSVNSTTAFQIQNASGYSLLNVDSTNSITTVGNVTTASGQGIAGQLVFADGTADGFGGTIKESGTLAANATYNLPNVSGTQTICTTLSTTACDSVYQPAGSYLLQSPTANDLSTSSFNGYQYSFTQNGTGAAGNLQLTNGGTNPALDVVGSGNPSGTNALVTINNTAGTPSGNSLDIQNGGVNELSVDYNGNVTQNGGTSTTDTINGQTISAAANFTGTVTAATSLTTPIVTSAAALSISSGGTSALTVDTSGAAALNIGNTHANAINIGNGSITTGITGSVTVSKKTTLGTTASGSLLTNNGATNNFACAYTSVSGTFNSGSWTTGKTVNDCTQFNFTDTGATSITAIPAPTAGAGSIIYINNLSTSTNSISVLGVTLPVGDTEMLIYDGTNWTTGASGSAGAITLQNAYNNSGSAAPSILTTTASAVTVQPANSGGQTGAQEIFGVHANHSGDTLGSSILSVTSYGIGVNLGSSTAQSGYDIQFDGNSNRVIGVISATAANQAGGNLTVEAGGASTTGLTTGAIGGALDLFGGNAAGSSNNAGGGVAIQGGTGSTNGAGGAVSLVGGTASGTGTGGTASVKGGLASSTNGSVGGGVSIAGANGAGGSGATAGGAAGGVTITSGNGGAGSGTSSTGGNSANIQITGGTGGNATSGGNNGNGGSIFLTPGQAGTGGTTTAGVPGSGGVGVPGVVSIDVPVFTSKAETFSTSPYAVPQGDIDSYSTVVVTDSFGAGATVTVAPPTNQSPGRTFYLASAAGNPAFTLSLNSGALNIYVTANTTAALIWNGTAWTASSADTSLQGVYNDTASSPAAIVTTSSTKTIQFQAGTSDDSASLFNVMSSTTNYSVLDVDSVDNVVGVNLGTQTPVSGTPGIELGGNANETIGVISAAATNAAGANLTVIAASANSTGVTTGNVGGNLVLDGGNAAGSNNNAGGNATLQGGTGVNAGAGGTATVKGGAAGGTGAGGSVNITGANGGGTTTGGAGGNITLQGGSAGGTGNNNGGTISLAGGGATGTGQPGVVNLDATVFNSNSETFTQTANNQDFCVATGGSCTVAAPALQTNLDTYGTIVMNVAGAFTGATVTMPTPTNTSPGRVIYVSASSGSVAFTLAATGMSSVNMSSGNTATLVWNGSAWSGTTTASSLQQVYNNTSTAPASIITTSATKNILFQAGAGDDNPDVFQVGNSAAAPVININTTNTATGENVSDNGGVESGITGWTAFAGTSGATVSQNTTAADLASGVGSVNVNIPGAGTGGVNNDLNSTALLNNTQYNVSFDVLSSTGSPTLTVAYYENSTPTLDATCTVPTNGTINSTSFFKYVCYFKTDAATLATSNFLRISTTATGAEHLYIDNLFVGPQNTAGTADTGDLQVGGPLSQGLTLLTLDTFASDPFTGTLNQNMYGSMYYNTTLGRIQCYESDGWGSCGAAPDTNLILEPEYVGAVLNPGGTTVCSGCSTSLSAQNTHIGTMTANICSGTSRQGINTTICGATDEFNYYQWTTSQVTSQSYSIFVKYQLPPTFGGFASSTTINMEAESSDTTNANVYYTLFDNNGDECAPGTSNTDPVDHNRTLVTTSNNVWQKVHLVADPTNSGTSGCTFSANDVITFRVDLYSANNANAFAGQITFTMLGK